MKNAELRAKLHAVGKRCLAAAKETVPDRDELGAAMVELHGCLELVLELVEDVDDEIEARVVVALARLR